MKRYGGNKCILLSERSQCKKATILYSPNYLASWKRQNYGESKKISGHQGLWGKEEINKQSTEDF